MSTITGQNLNVILLLLLFLEYIYIYILKEQTFIHCKWAKPKYIASSVTGGDCSSQIISSETCLP